MKHILIPTDFTDRSLELVRFVANVFADEEELNITLLHVLQMPDGITELLMLPRRSRHRGLITDQFRQGYASLQEIYRQTIRQLRVDFLYGDTYALLRNYLFAQSVDVIIYPDNYRFRKPCRDSVDPRPLIRKAGCAVLTNVWEQDIRILQTATL